MEEEREKAKVNPNGIVYAVAVKTDVDIIVGNLLRQIRQPVLFSALEQYNCVRGHMQTAGERLQISQNEA